MKCPTCGHEVPNPRVERDAEIVRMLKETSLQAKEIATMFGLTASRVGYIYSKATGGRSFFNDRLIARKAREGK